MNMADDLYKYFYDCDPISLAPRKTLSPFSDPQSPRGEEAAQVFHPGIRLDPPVYSLDAESAQSSDSTYKPVETYKQSDDSLNITYDRSYLQPSYPYLRGPNVPIRKTSDEEPHGDMGESHYNPEPDDDLASSSETSSLNSLDDDDDIQSDRKVLRNLFNEILENPPPTANPASSSATLETTIPKFLVFDGEPLRIFLSPDLDNYSYKRKWIARHGGNCVDWIDEPDLWIGNPWQPQAGEFISESWLNACFMARQLVDPKPYVVAKFIAVAASTARTAERISRVLAGETDVERHASEYTIDKLQWGYFSKQVEELDRMAKQSRKRDRENKKKLAEGRKDSPVELDSNDEQSTSEDDSEEESNSETEDESSSDEDEPFTPPAKRQKVRSGVYDWKGWQEGFGYGEKDSN